MTTQILLGDCREVMKTLPDNSVQCVVTSPPYYGLRDYGHTQQIGLESTPEAYVAELVAVFREVRRVLRGDGVCWMNLGDSYGHGTAAGRQQSINPGVGANCPEAQNSIGRNGLSAKQLIGIPWRVAFALQADGWYLRQDLIWNKPNPMPESVTDRCTKSHEYVFLLSKSARYFWDNEAIKELETMKPQSRLTPRKANPNAKVHGMPEYRQQEGGVGGGTRNRRSVWTIATTPYSGAHFATMPPKLAETCILAGTSEAGCCSQCGQAWVRVVEKTKYEPPVVDVGVRNVDPSRQDKTRKLSGKEYNEQVNITTLGFRPVCTCNAPAIPCTVLDPFGGSGTTGEVAQRLGRDAILIELNPDYLHLADRRTAQGGLMLGAEVA